MSFWKQSEDPWDRKPEKPRPAKEPKGEILDSLKAWNEDRKARAKEKEEAKRLPPEPCPWCGQDMEQGYLTGGRDAVRWYPGVYMFRLFQSLDGMNVLDEGSGWSSYCKTVWLCRDCKKMVFNMPEEQPPTLYAVPEETKEEEESEE